MENKEVFYSCDLEADLSYGSTSNQVKPKMKLHQGGPDPYGSEVPLLCLVEWKRDHLLGGGSECGEAYYSRGARSMAVGGSAGRRTTLRVLGAWLCEAASFPL